MTTFDKREEGFEKKFALDEEQKFKAEARRDKLLGLWVAERDVTVSASFRDGLKDQARNLEIPGSCFACPGMTFPSQRDGKLTPP